MHQVLDKMGYSRSGDMLTPALWIAGLACSYHIITFITLACSKPKFEKVHKATEKEQQRYTELDSLQAAFIQQHSNGNGGSAAAAAAQSRGNKLRSLFGARATVSVPVVR
jgi:hypothetical protein